MLRGARPCFVTLPWGFMIYPLTVTVGYSQPSQVNRREQSMSEPVVTYALTHMPACRLGTFMTPDNHPSFVGESMLRNMFFQTYLAAPLY